MALAETTCLPAADGRHRVAFVIDSLGIGGAERHLVRLLDGLQRSGEWDTSIFCLDRTGAFLVDADRLGVPVSGRVGKWAVRRTVPMVLQLWRHFRLQRPVIAHCYLNKSGLLGCIAARAARVPHIITTRRSVHEFSGAKLYLYRTLAWFMDRCSTTVIAVSAAAAQQAMQEGTPAEKIIVIPNGVHVPPPGSRNRDPGSFPLLVSVGTLRSIKGHRFLIEAMPEVLAAYSSARLVLVGDGPDRPALEEAARALHIQGQVDFLGSRADVTAVLRSADLFVLPSVVEGMPNAVLEAMAVRLPVVATRVGGVLEVVRDGETGILVDAESSGALARGIIRMSVDPSLRAACAEAGYALMLSTYSRDREVAATAAVYHSVLHSS